MSTKRSTRPVFCIVTPSFNQAQYLEQTIQSVLNQEGRGTDFEIQYAVVDGGSRDGSKELIRSFRGELSYWCSEPDRGQSHAINKGFERLQGDIYAYINSDDFYLPGAFRRIAERFQESANADLLHGVCQRVDAEGNHLGDQQSDITGFSEIVDLWSHWLNPRPNRNFIQPEVFWTDRFRQSVGEFNERLYYTMDFDYWLRGLDAGMEVAAVSERVAAFRIHAAQKTSARNASILELIDDIAPYLTIDDRRISPEQRKRLLILSQMSRRMIEAADSAPERRLMTLIALAADQPSLLKTEHYWRQFRRNSKRVFWKRDVA